MKKEKVVHFEQLDLSKIYTCFNNITKEIEKHRITNFIEQLKKLQVF